MMLAPYLECGFSLARQKSFRARGTPFLVWDAKKRQYFFINDFVHLNRR